MFGNLRTKSTSFIFTPLGLVKIEKCPRCESKRFNLIDNNNWFHCWECRFVEQVSKLKGVEIIQ